MEEANAQIEILVRGGRVHENDARGLLCALGVCGMCV